MCPGVKLYAILFIIVASFCLRADNDLIRRVEVSAELVVPPQVDHKNGNVLSPKVDSVNRWVMVKIEFTAKKRNGSPKLEKDGKSWRMSFDGFMDDVKMDVRVLFDTKFRIDDEILYCLYTGRTEFFTVRSDGKRHLALMFVPAKLIDRYSLSADGASIRKAVKNDFMVEVVFSQYGKVLARGYSNISGQRDFEQKCRSVSENFIIEDGVFPRLRTPWALLGADNFDVEKDLSRLGK